MLYLLEFIFGYVEIAVVAEQRVLLIVFATDVASVNDCFIFMV